MKIVLSVLPVFSSAVILWISYDSIAATNLLSSGGFMRCGTPMVQAAYNHLLIAFIGVFPLFRFFKRANLQNTNRFIKGVVGIASVAWLVNAFALLCLRHWLI